jgi:hypothetical protein
MNATLLRIFVAIFTVVTGSAWAQESKLPPCPKDAMNINPYADLVPRVVKARCRGTISESGATYDGEFQDRMRNGYGTYLEAGGGKYVGGWKV